MLPINNTDLIGSDGDHVHTTILYIAWFSGCDVTNHTTYQCCVFVNKNYLLKVYNCLQNNCINTSVKLI